MPRGNQQGPMGQGPMTGRGLGFCAGNDRPGFMEPSPGLGLGRGWGRGRGFGAGAGRGGRFGGRAIGWTAQRAAAVAEDLAQEETLLLRQEVADLNEQLAAMQERLAALEPTPKAVAKTGEG